MPDLNFLESLTIQVRRDILRMVHKVNSGHPGGSLGCAELFVVRNINAKKTMPAKKTNKFTMIIQKHRRTI